jgi:hypothetical protein
MGDKNLNDLLPLAQVDMDLSRDPQAIYGYDEAPTLDLAHRPNVQNADGSVSTIRSMGVNLDGKEYLIPTVSKDGRIMTPDEAVAEFRRTGEHIGVYPSIEASDRAAQMYHEDQAKQVAEDRVRQALLGAVARK